MPSGGPQSRCQLLSSALPGKAGSRPHTAPTETQRDRGRGRGTRSGGRWQPQGPQTQRGEGGEGPQAQGRAGPGGPLTGPSVDLEILVIWSFLTLHLLGTPAGCEGREIGLQLTGHPALLQGSSPCLPYLPRHTPGLVLSTGGSSWDTFTYSRLPSVGTGQKEGRPYRKGGRPH